MDSRDFSIKCFVYLVVASSRRQSTVALESTLRMSWAIVTTLEKWLAKIVLAVPAYGHFSVEHNRGHHSLVSTPEDPASSRLGESLYSFAVREISGTFVRGWQLEGERLAKDGKSFLSPHNEILHSYALSALFQGSLVIYFGWILVPFLIMHNFWAWSQLTLANYIEHYGLLRDKKANGNYERCKPHHSWNANYIVSNIVLFHLERHSDHHAYPARRYQSLRNFDNIPELPNGYFGMYMLSYVPWLWFKVMDKRVLALPHIQGDLINSSGLKTPIRSDRNEPIKIWTSLMS